MPRSPDLEPGRAPRGGPRRTARPAIIVSAMRRFAPRWAWAGVLALAVPPGRPLAAAPAPADAVFELTVDSIMRGPGLVGYPPGALRWSGDSERLYFEWRPRGEDEPATWEVARACLGAAAAPAPNASASAAKTCEPRRLTDDERRLAPPAGGEWDPAHRRSVGIVDGDVVVVDTVARTRTLITRTAAVEGHARWSDGGRAVTFVRDGGLHRVWVDRRPDRATPRRRSRRSSSSPTRGRRSPARRPPTASSSSSPRRRSSSPSSARTKRARRGRTPARTPRRWSRVAVAERQSVDDLVLAHQGKVAYALVVDKPAAARRADVPSYVTGSSYPELLPGRDPRRRRAGGPASGGRRPGGEDRHHGVAERRRDRSARRSAPLEPAGGVGRRPLRRDHRRLDRQQAPLRGRARADARPDADRRAPARHRVGARPRRVRPAADHDGLRARHGAALVPVRARRLDAPLRRQSRRAGCGAAAAHERRLGNHRREAHARRQAVPHRVDRGRRRRSPGLRAAGRGRPPHPADDGAGRARDRTVPGRRDVGAAVVVGDASARGVPGARPQGDRHGAGPRRSTPPASSR